MPGFGDSAFIVILALLLFGPKKLPVLARQLGKLMADFRRASNEFRSQMEEELRISEQADRQKEVAALEASSTNTIAPPAEPDFALPADSDSLIPPTDFTPSDSESKFDDTRYQETSPIITSESPLADSTDPQIAPQPVPQPTPTESESAPTPIATSGDLSILPPATGLPEPRSARPSPAAPVTSSESASSAGESAVHDAEFETETLHG